MSPGLKHVAVRKRLDVREVVDLAAEPDVVGQQRRPRTQHARHAVSLVQDDVHFLRPSSVEACHRSGEPAPA